VITFLFRRLLAIVPTLLVIVTLAFGLMHLAPGGPFDGERRLPDEVMRALEASYHLDWPVFPLHRELNPVTGARDGPWSLAPLGRWHETQYVHYLGNLLRGELGPSTRYPNTGVGELLLRGLPATFIVGMLALLLSLGLGLATGLLAGWRPNTGADYSAMALVMIGISVPSFVLAPLLVLVFSLWLGWLPVAGFGTWQQLIMPTVCLAALNTAYVARLSRGAMREIMPRDFIRAARALGYAEFDIVTLHALRGVLVPVVSFLGPAIAGVMTGSLVIETIFNLPGIGRHFVQAALNRDYTLVMGTIIFYSLLLLLANLLVDLAYAWLDPRVRYG
jgi:oligopeptide transport system permease protein